MDIHSESPSPEVNCIRLTGRLDTAGVDRVETRFNAMTVAAGHHAMVDLAGVSFLSSMGVRMLVTAARAMGKRGKRIVLFAAQPLVQESITTMGIDQLMAVVGSESEAHALVHAG